MITSLTPSPPDKRDFIYEFIGTYGAELPTTLDMRSELLAVRDQGNNGACVAFTASAIKEVQERRDTGFDEYMSPLFIYEHRENTKTEGMYPRDLMRILTKIGSVPETAMPYNKPARFTTKLRRSAYNYRIKGYASITTIDALKSSLVKHGPALLGIPVYNYGASLWKKGTSDVFRGGHAVAIVGWNETGFIIRNSWGPTWNGDGHTIFPFTDWGLQWEVWSTIDADSVSVIAPPVRPITRRRRRFPRRIVTPAAKAERLALLRARIILIQERARRPKPSRKPKHLQ